MELKLAIKNVPRAVQQVVNQPVVMDALEAVQVLVLVNAVGNVQIIVAEVVVIVAQTIVTYGAVMAVSKVVRAVVRIAVKMVAKEVQNALLVVIPLVLVLVLEAVKKPVPKPVLMLVQEVAQHTQNPRLICQFNDCKRRQEIKMYQLIKSIFQK